MVKYRNEPTVNFPGEAPLASVLAALPAAPVAGPPRRSGRAPAPKVIVDPEAPALASVLAAASRKARTFPENQKARTLPKKPPYYGKSIEGATQRANGKWTSHHYPGREFDDLDEYRAAKKQRMERRAAYSAQLTAWINPGKKIRE